MQPKLVDSHRWTISRKGKNYNVEVKVSLVPSRLNPGSTKKPGKYRYTLFYKGEFVRVWDRGTHQTLPSIKNTAEKEFDDYLLTDL